jgi:hypothetical protein
MSQIWYGLAKSLAYPSGEEGGSFLVQMIFTCLRLHIEGGGGVGALCSDLFGPASEERVKQYFCNGNHMFLKLFKSYT